MGIGVEHWASNSYNDLDVIHTEIVKWDNCYVACHTPTLVTVSGLKTAAYERDSPVYHPLLI